MPAERNLQRHGLRGHRRRRLHRIQPRGRPGGARRPGDGHRQPPHRQARKPDQRCARRRNPRDRRCPRRGRRGRHLRGGAAADRLPSGRPDRRPPLGRASRRRRSDQRVGDHRDARGRARHRRTPGGQHVHRRRAVRRRRRAADTRGQPDPAAGPLRPEQAGRRGLLRAVHPPARPVDRLGALRQRLRATPGRARRGGRGGDLLRPPHRRHRPDRVRRRRSDARLGRRGRRRQGQPARRRLGDHGAGQHRPRAGDVGARAHRGAQRRVARPAARPSRSSSPSGPARCAAAAWTSPGPARSSGGRRRCRYGTGCGRSSPASDPRRRRS